MSIRKNNNSKYLPLLFGATDTSAVAFYNGRVITQKTFLSHVAQVRKYLPSNRFSINICENRYHFLVAFSACVSLGQISLLPGSRAILEIRRLQDMHEDNYLVDEQIIEEVCSRDESSKVNSKSNFQIESEQVVVIVFTSGSTGIPNANPKTWRQLTESAIRVKERFGINDIQQHTVIATVPPQHMYGFETTIVFPLIIGVAIHSGRPFFPSDIQQAIGETAAPHILVTTPLHLNACKCEQTGWPEIDFVISATAHLSEIIAREAEKILKTRILEIYGCSEVGAIATRRLTKQMRWKLLKNYRLTTTGESSLLDVPGCEVSIALPDLIESHGDKYFKLAGRCSDLINIGGKRGSLKDLTDKLKLVDGVRDAVFIMPDEVPGKRVRLIALVVAPGCNEKTLRRELGRLVDMVFLPRPLILVQQLPYNELGKLPRAILLELLTRHLDKNKFRETG